MAKGDAPGSGCNIRKKKKNIRKAADWRPKYPSGLHSLPELRDQRHDVLGKQQTAHLKQKRALRRLGGWMRARQGRQEAVSSVVAGDDTGSWSHLTKEGSPRHPLSPPHQLMSAWTAPSHSRRSKGSYVRRSQVSGSGRLKWVRRRQLTSGVCRDHSYLDSSGCSASGSPAHTKKLSRNQKNRTLHLWRYMGLLSMLNFFGGGH